MCVCVWGGGGGGGGGNMLQLSGSLRNLFHQVSDVRMHAASMNVSEAEHQNVQEVGRTDEIGQYWQSR